jgi:hypothetical protein
MMRNVDASKSKIDLKKVESAAARMSAGHSQVASTQAEPNEDESKDAFFAAVAEMAEAMIARHSKEFAIGTLVLAAKFIAEGRPLVKGDAVNSEPASAIKSG